MSDYSNIGKATGNLIKFLFGTTCIFVPLGMWQLIDIIIWVFRHIKININ